MMARWRAFARLVGDAQARLLLGVVYYLMVVPVGALLRWRTREAAGWVQPETSVGSPLERAGRLG